MEINIGQLSQKAIGKVIYFGIEFAETLTEKLHHQVFKKDCG